MPVNVDNRGRENSINIDPRVLADGKGTISIGGHRNIVNIASGCTLLNLKITLGSDCRIDLGQDSRLAAIDIVALGKGRVSIGQNCQFTWGSRFLLHEAGAISVGAECLIASGTLFTVSDMHSILDLDTGERINPARDIVVEDHVWIGLQANVLKGVRIGTGSVVAMGSIVTQDIPAHSLAAGVPARVVRSRIGWDARLL